MRRQQPTAVPHTNLIMIAAALCALAFGWYFARQLGGTPDAPVLAKATLYPDDFPRMPAFSLNDQYGRAFTQQNFDGAWHLVFFGFTACPDICPNTLAVLQQTLDELQDQAMRGPLRVVFISVDPERDTPEKIKSYLEYFDPGFIGLSGSLPAIKEISAYFGVYFSKTENTSQSANYSVDHSAGIFLLNPTGHLQALFSAPHNSVELSHDLRTLSDFYSDSL